MNTSNNPLVEPEFGATKPPLIDGEYACKFIGVEVVRGKKFQSEDEEDKLKWAFAVLSESHTLSKRTSLSTWAKPGTESGVVKILKTMDLKGLKAADKSGEFAYKKEALWALIQKQIGKFFSLTVEVVDEKFNNIVNIRAITADEAKMMVEQAANAPEVAKVQEKVAAQKKLKEISLEDDKMPF